MHCQLLEPSGQMQRRVGQRAAPFLRQRDLCRIEAQHLAQVIGEACLAPGSGQACGLVVDTQIGEQVERQTRAVAHPARHGVDAAALDPPGRQHRLTTRPVRACTPRDAFQRLAQMAGNML